MSKEAVSKVTANKEGGHTFEILFSQALRIKRSFQPKETRQTRNLSTLHGPIERDKEAGKKKQQWTKERTRLPTARAMLPYNYYVAVAEQQSGYIPNARGLTANAPCLKSILTYPAPTFCHVFIPAWHSRMWEATLWSQSASLRSGRGRMTSKRLSRGPSSPVSGSMLSALVYGKRGFMTARMEVRVWRVATRPAYGGNVGGVGHVC